MSKLSLRPALKNNLEGEKSIEYLSNQNYLNFKSIKIFINNSFINELPFGYNLIDKSGNIVGFLGTMFKGDRIQHLSDQAKKIVGIEKNVNLKQ